MPERFLATIKQLVRDTFNSASQHDLGLHGAAIAFYTIFSSAPLIVLILALLNFFLGEQQTINVFTDYLSQLTSQDMADSLMQMSQVSRHHSSGLIPSLIATLLLLFGATTVITQLKKTLNTIWGINQVKINSVTAYFFNRAAALIIIFILTALFLASLLLEGGLAFFTNLFLPYLPDILVPLLKFFSSLLSILITIIFFTLIFKLLPDLKARWKDIFVGSSVTTILFLFGKYLVGFYLAGSSMQASYKAAGTFIIFIVWIYYNVQIVLLGAEFTQVYTKRFGKNLRAGWKAKIDEFKE